MTHVPRARRGDRRKRAVLNPLYAAGLALLAHARGRRRCGQGNPTQVGRALAQLGIELIAAYSPQARGRSERMFGTLQKPPAPGAAPRRDRHHGRGQSLSRGASGRRINARFARPAADTGSAFVAFAGTLEDILCAQEDRVVAGDNTVATRTARCRSRPIATATTTSRRRSGCTNIPTATWPSSTDPGVWRATAPTAKP